MSDIKGVLRRCLNRLEPRPLQGTDDPKDILLLTLERRHRDPRRLQGAPFRCSRGHGMPDRHLLPLAFSKTQGKWTPRVRCTSCSIANHRPSFHILRARKSRGRWRQIDTAISCETLFMVVGLGCRRLESIPALRTFPLAYLV